MEFSESKVFTNDTSVCDIQAKDVDSPTKLIEFILQEFRDRWPNFLLHCSKSYGYIQLWKNSWNNLGKTGIHFELCPSRNKSFLEMYGRECFVITMKLHNEASTNKIFAEIPKTQTCFQKEYSFLKSDISSSVSELLRDIKRGILKYEEQVDNAHNN